MQDVQDDDMDDEGARAWCVVFITAIAMNTANTGRMKERTGDERKGKGQKGPTGTRRGEEPEPEPEPEP